MQLSEWMNWMNEWVREQTKEAIHPVHTSSYPSLTDFWDSSCLVSIVVTCKSKIQFAHLCRVSGSRRLARLAPGRLCLHPPNWRDQGEDLVGGTHCILPATMPQYGPKSMAAVLGRQVFGQQGAPQTSVALDPSLLNFWDISLPLKSQKHLFYMQ